MRNSQWCWNQLLKWSLLGRFFGHCDGVWMLVKVPGGLGDVFYFYGHGSILIITYELWIPFLGILIFIYRLFWCSPGVQGFDPSPEKSLLNAGGSPAVTIMEWIPVFMMYPVDTYKRTIGTIGDGYLYSRICFNICTILIMQYQCTFVSFVRVWVCIAILAE